MRREKEVASVVFPFIIARFSGRTETIVHSRKLQKKKRWGGLSFPNVKARENTH